MRRVITISICICSILLVTLTGCQKNEEKDINDKLDAELEYEEDLIFKIANKYAKGEYIEDDEIKWDYTKGDIQKINSTWNMLILDLTEVNVSNQDIMDFSNSLNDLLVSINKENEIAMIDELNDMYAKLVIFKQAYSENKNLIEKNKIKFFWINITSIKKSGSLFKLYFYLVFWV